MATKATWEAEQIRIASILEPTDLEVVAKASRMLAIMLETRASVGDAAWRDSFKDEDSQKFLKQIRTAFAKAEAVLAGVGNLSKPD